jgi:hypothetical protein
MRERERKRGRGESERARARVCEAENMTTLLVYATLSY